MRGDQQHPNVLPDISNTVEMRWGHTWKDQKIGIKSTILPFKTVHHDASGFNLWLGDLNAVSIECRVQIQRLSAALTFCILRLLCRSPNPLAMGYCLCDYQSVSEYFALVPSHGTYTITIWYSSFHNAKPSHDIYTRARANVNDVCECVRGPPSLLFLLLHPPPRNTESVNDYIPILGPWE